jgi:hypothetical protein
MLNEVVLERKRQKGEMEQLTRIAQGVEERKELRTQDGGRLNHKVDQVQEEIRKLDTQAEMQDNMSKALAKRALEAREENVVCVC